MFTFFLVYFPNTPSHLCQQGGNFHLKVGGAKSSGNAGDPMLWVAVSGGSRIYMDACCLYDHSFII